MEEELRLVGLQLEALALENAWLKVGDTKFFKFYASHYASPIVPVFCNGTRTQLVDRNRFDADPD
jgi:hypothetical protein